MRGSILRNLYRLFPFDLSGDCLVPPATEGVRVSCIINFYGRLNLLSGILHSLAEQRYPRHLFEVVLVEDRGGTEDGRAMAECFSDRLQIFYAPLQGRFGLMGHSRNYGLSLSRGEYILFLDDDTVILQKDFLCTLDALFQQKEDVDALIPHGRASYALAAGRYDFHDPFFMTSRCTAYRRTVLEKLGGFMSCFVGQEDVEFVVRFLMAGSKAEKAPELEYFHPPLLVPNFRKPKAVGFSFFGLKSRYPFLVWLLVLANCSRHAPLYLLPARRYREMGRFGIGFLAGVIMSLFKKKGFRYS